MATRIQIGELFSVRPGSWLQSGGLQNGGLTAAAAASALAVALFVATSASAQPPEQDRPPDSAEPVVLPLGSAKITTLRVRPAAAQSDVLRSGLRPGVALTRALVRSAISVLHQSGRWADVQIYREPSPAGLTVRVELLPRTVIDKIIFDGELAVDRDELLRAMQVDDGAEIDRSAMTLIEERALTFYRSQGYDDVRVALHLDGPEENALRTLKIKVRPGPPTRIRKLQVALAGDDDYAPVELRTLVGLRPGDRLTERLLREAIRDTERRLRTRGYLEAEVTLASVDRKRGRADLTLTLKTGPEYTLRFSGQSAYTQSELAKTLDLAREALSPSSLASIEGRIVEFFQKRGYLDARVRAQSIELPDHQPTPRYPPRKRRLLGVSITAGPQWHVREMRFPGAQHVDAGELQSRVELYLSEDLPGEDFLAPVDSDRASAAGAGGDSEIRRRNRRPPNDMTRLIFHQPSYEDAIQSIRELYESEGFLDVQVGPLEALRSTERHKISIRIPVLEGPRTMLHSVVFGGIDEALARTLAEISGLERGQPFSELRLEQARIKVADHYREQGFFFARVESVTRFSANRLRAEVLFEIVEGFEARLDGLMIRGNVNTSEELIRARADLQPGERLTPSALQSAQERLLALGVFTSVTVAPEDPDLPERKKRIEISVTERNRGFLDIQPGFSTGDGVRATVEAGHRNVGGYAIGLRGRAQLGFQFLFVDDQIEQRFEALPTEDRLERNLSAGLAFPHLPLLSNTNLSLNLVNVRDNERDFGFDKWGATVALSWRPSRIFSATLAEDLEWNSVDLFVDEDNIEGFLRDNPDPRLRRILRVPDGVSIILATRLRLALDLRDNPFITRRGVFASIATEYARTLDTSSSDADFEPFFSHFLKAGLTLNGYLPIGPLVIATQLRLGRVFHLEEASKTYPNRAYFLGGVDTLRGFFQDALIPQDLADEIDAGSGLTANDIVRGADAYALLRTELRFPIWANLHGGLFLDLGNTWADPDRLLEEFKLRPTTGLGVRFRTPVGFLALDYGFNVLRRKSLGEGFGALHFAIGLF